jgi:hypothetical protein
VQTQHNHLIQGSAALLFTPFTGAALGACLVHRLACFSGRTQTPPPLLSKQASLNKLSLLDSSNQGGRQSASGAATTNGNGNGTGEATAAAAAAGGGGESGSVGNANGSGSSSGTGPVKRTASQGSAAGGGSSGGGGGDLKPYSSALPAIIARFRRKVGGWVSVKRG